MVVRLLETNKSYFKISKEEHWLQPLEWQSHTWMVLWIVIQVYTLSSKTWGFCQSFIKSTIFLSIPSTQNMEYHIILYFYIFRVTNHQCIANWNPFFKLGSLVWSLLGRLHIRHHCSATLCLFCRGVYEAQVRVVLTHGQGPWEIVMWISHGHGPKTMT